MPKCMPSHTPPSLWLKVKTNTMFEGGILRAAALAAAMSGGGWTKDLKKMHRVLWLV